MKEKTMASAVLQELHLGYLIQDLSLLNQADFPFVLPARSPTEMLSLSVTQACTQRHQLQCNDCLPGSRKYAAFADRFAAACSCLS